MKFIEILRNFQANSLIDGWSISYNIALTGMSLDLTDDKSTLVQVIMCVPGNKPLPGSMLTQFYVARHMASLAS